MEKVKPIAQGTVRVKVKDSKPYKYIKTTWKKTDLDVSNALHAIELFKAHKNESLIVDKKNPDFYKGQLSSDYKIQGARINVLPDGQKLDKAYSLFAPHLTFHDQQTDSHWDALFQNTGGTFAYLYTLDKIQQSKTKKYKVVDEFTKHYPKLQENVSLALKKKDDIHAMPMYTLLKTYMRIGNEIYFKAHGHKGLSTLKKGDISIAKDIVTFSYIAKDGVPQKICKPFPAIYVNRLKKLLEQLKKDSFVFTNSHGHPLQEAHFKQAFKDYCGKEFYPHIVRSHFATTHVKDFIKSNKNPKKEEVISLFKEIAGALGHKKFNKKKNEWEESYTVTISHYINPELVEKLKQQLHGQLK